MCSNAAFSRRRRWDGLVGVKLTLEGSQDQGSCRKRAGLGLDRGLKAYGKSHPHED
jgi:hypothetical protein